jgi:hypothetical protein
MSPSPTSPRKRKSTREDTLTKEQIDLDVRHVGIGIDTARYGHHASFLREDKQPACSPITIMESRAGYDLLKGRLEHLHSRFPNAHLHLRMDAAGQYAANLERFVRSLTHGPTVLLRVRKPLLSSWPFGHLRIRCDDVAPMLDSCCTMPFGLK